MPACEKVTKLCKYIIYFIYLLWILSKITDISQLFWIIFLTHEKCVNSLAGDYKPGIKTETAWLQDQSNSYVLCIPPSWGALS